MTDTERIRWEPTQYGGFTGHVGTLADTNWLFQIWSAASVGGDWQLDSTLPGRFGQHSRADDPATLKADAEFMLEEFVSSLGASFPDGTADGRPACRTCRRRITLIGDDWVTDEGTIACTATSAALAPHQPETEAGQ